MLKKIAQKLLVTYFGKFITGFSRENLEVQLLRGEFSVKNIAINQQFFDSLETPFRLVKSHIGQLSMNIPLSKLGSQSSNCQLSDVYLAVGIKQQRDWSRGVKTGIDVLNYLERTIQDLMRRSGQTQAGMLSKTVKKIVDNIHLTFSKIHVKLLWPENSFSCGIYLQSITLRTTDEAGKQIFMVKEEQGPVHKRMQINRMKFYWDDAHCSIQNSKPANNLLEINLQLKIVNYPVSDNTKPLYHIMLRFQTIELRLNSRQTDQMNQLVNLLIKFVNRNQHSQQTQTLSTTKWQQIQQQIKSASLAILQDQPVESKAFDQIASKLQAKMWMEKVLVLAKQIVKDKTKQRVKKKKKSFFGKLSDVALDDQELKAIEAMFQRREERHANSIFFQMQVKFEGIIFKSLNSKDQRILVQLIGFQISFKRPQDFSWINSQVKLQGSKLQVQDQILMVSDSGNLLNAFFQKSFGTTNSNNSIIKINSPRIRISALGLRKKEQWSQSIDNLLALVAPLSSEGKQVQEQKSQQKYKVVVQMKGVCLQIQFIESLLRVQYIQTILQDTKIQSKLIQVQLQYNQAQVFNTEISAIFHLDSSHLHCQFHSLHINLQASLINLLSQKQVSPYSQQLVELAGKQLMLVRTARRNQLIEQQLLRVVQEWDNQGQIPVDFEIEQQALKIDKKSLQNLNSIKGQSRRENNFRVNCSFKSIAISFLHDLQPFFFLQFQSVAFSYADHWTLAAQSLQLLNSNQKSIAFFRSFALNSELQIQIDKSEFVWCSASMRKVLVYSSLLSPSNQIQIVASPKHLLRGYLSAHVQLKIKSLQLLLDQMRIDIQRLSYLNLRNQTHSVLEINCSILLQHNSSRLQTCCHLRSVQLTKFVFEDLFALSSECKLESTRTNSWRLLLELNQKVNEEVMSVFPESRVKTRSQHKVTASNLDFNLTNFDLNLANLSLTIGQAIQASFSLRVGQGHATKIVSPHLQLSRQSNDRQIKTVVVLDQITCELDPKFYLLLLQQFRSESPSSSIESSFQVKVLHCKLAVNCSNSFQLALQQLIYKADSRNISVSASSTSVKIRDVIQEFQVEALSYSSSADKSMIELKRPTLPLQYSYQYFKLLELFPSSPQNQQKNSSLDVQIIGLYGFVSMQEQTLLLLRGDYYISRIVRKSKIVQQINLMKCQACLLRTDKDEESILQPFNMSLNQTIQNKISISQVSSVNLRASFTQTQSEMLLQAWRRINSRAPASQPFSHSQYVFNLSELSLQIRKGSSLKLSVSQLQGTYVQEQGTWSLQSFLSLKLYFLNQQLAEFQPILEKGKIILKVSHHNLCDCLQLSSNHLSLVYSAQAMQALSSFSETRGSRQDATFLVNRSGYPVIVLYEQEQFQVPNQSQRQIPQGLKDLRCRVGQSQFKLRVRGKPKLLVAVPKAKLKLSYQVSTFRRALVIQSSYQFKNKTFVALSLSLISKKAKFNVSCAPNHTLRLPYDLTAFQLSGSSPVQIRLALGMLSSQKDFTFDLTSLNCFIFRYKYEFTNRTPILLQIGDALIPPGFNTFSKDAKIINGLAPDKIHLHIKEITQKSKIAYFPCYVVDFTHLAKISWSSLGQRKQGKCVRKGYKGEPTILALSSKCQVIRIVWPNSKKFLQTQFVCGYQDWLVNTRQSSLKLKISVQQVPVLQTELMSRVLTIRYRFKVRNSSSRSLRVNQCVLQKDGEMALALGERVELKLGVEEGEGERWVSVSEGQSRCFRLACKQQFIDLKVRCDREGNIIISQLNQVQQYDSVILNHSPLYQLTLRWLDSRGLFLDLLTHVPSQAPTGLALPQHASGVVFISISGPEICTQFQIDVCQGKPSHSQIHSKESLTVLYVRLTVQEGRRIVQVSERRMGQRSSSSMGKVLARSVDVSVMGREKQRRQEVAFCILQQIGLDLMSDNQQTNLELKIKGIIVQSPSKRLNQYPVILFTEPDFLSLSAFFVRPALQTLTRLSLTLSPFMLNLTTSQLARLSESFKGGGGGESMRFPYLELVQISKVEANVNFKRNSRWGSVLLNSVDSLDDFSFKLKEIRIENQYAHSQAIEQQLYDIYSKQFLNIFLPLIGRVPIIGLPSAIFEHINKGLEKEGEIAERILKGSGSVVLGTVGGLFSSIESLTSTLGNGLASAISVIQQDDKYIRVRSKRNPKNLAQGMKEGSLSFVTSFAQGISGVVLKPYRGAVRQGGIGFLKGIGQGFSGFLLKPISGILDFSSKAAQGVKNSSKSLARSDWIHPFQLKRSRRIRNLGYQGVVQCYNQYEARLKGILQSKQRFDQNIILWEKYGEDILILTDKRFYKIYQSKKINDFDRAEIQDLKLLSKEKLVQIKLEGGRKAVFNSVMAERFYELLLI